MPFGVFGENLTTEGLREDEVCVGDEFRIGTARLVVTQPRMPCYKLGLRFGDPQMPKRFVAHRRPGIYFAVVEEGEIGSGDAIERVRRDENGVTVADVLRLIVDEKGDSELLRRALRVPALADVWQREFRERLANLSPDF